MLLHKGSILLWRWVPRHFSFAVFACLAVLTLSACISIAREAEYTPPELMVPEGIHIRLETAVVTRGDVADISIFPGIVRTHSEHLNFGPVSAAFGSFYVQPGDEVVYGQLLARLDFEHVHRQIVAQEERIAQMRRSHTLDNGIAALDIEIATVENAMRMSEAEENEDEEAIAAAEAGRRQIENRRGELRLARERQTLTLRHETEHLEALRAQFAVSELRAPFDGVISYTTQHMQGTWVSAYQNLVYIIPDDGAVYAEYLGTTPFVTHRAVRVNAYIGGQVYDISRKSLTRSQRAQYSVNVLRFNIETDAPPPVGSYVFFHVYDQWQEDVLRVPRNTVFYEPEIGYYVNLVIDGRPVLTPIITGAHTETYVAVLEGLNEGDIVHVGS